MSEEMTIDELKREYRRLCALAGQERARLEDMREHFARQGDITAQAERLLSNMKTQLQEALFSREGL